MSVASLPNISYIPIPDLSRDRAKGHLLLSWNNTLIGQQVPCSWMCFWQKHTKWNWSLTSNTLRFAENHQNFEHHVGECSCFFWVVLALEIWTADFGFHLCSWIFPAPRTVPLQGGGCGARRCADAAAPGQVPWRLDRNCNKKNM